MYVWFGDKFEFCGLDWLQEQIVKDLEGCGIKIYQFPQDEVSEDAEVTDSVNEDIPFAVVGSRDFVEIGDKVMRARIYPWGIVKGKHYYINQIVSHPTIS